MLDEALLPLLNVIEALLIGDIKYKGTAVCTTIERVTK